MNREAIEQRIKMLESAVFETTPTIAQRRVFEHIAVFLRDLALEVSELHPEELTTEEWRVYGGEQEQINKLVLARDEQSNERDKLAEDLVDVILALVDVILAESDLYTPAVIILATQLRMQLDATKV
jgi:hypothetical protein